MNYEITNSSFAPVVKINLTSDESVKIENGSMIAKSTSVELNGKMNGKGFFKAIGRALTSGESFFVTHATCTENSGFVVVAPKLVGKIISLECSAEKQWTLNDGAFLASDNSVEYEMKRQSGIGAALTGGSGGLFNMTTKGEGTVMISAFGDIVEFELDGNSIDIDNFHAVAWSSGLTYTPKVASGVFGYTTGEGVILRFSGKGKVYMSTRNIVGLADSIKQYIPTSSNS